MSEPDPRSPRPAAGGPDEIVARVVVKFHDDVGLPWVDGVETRILEPDRRTWDALTQEFPGITLLRNVSNVEPAELQRLVEMAKARDATYRPPNFLAYFGIPCRRSIDPHRLAKRLREWRLVELAWVEVAPIGAAAPVGINGELPNQEYLEPPSGFAAPFAGGIDAVYAWSQCGDGAGQGVISYERAMATHQDITFPAPLAGITDDTGLYSTAPGHGTAVLGIIAMQDNSVGGVGIAYKLADFQWTSPFDGTATPIRRDALWAAIRYLTRTGAEPWGRVLLFEVQIPQVTDASGQVWTNMPVEVYDDYYQAIRLAISLGVVVVVPAGNGRRDLDAYVDASTGQALLDPDVRDSGAIFVGACAPTSRTRWKGALGSGTNFGRRVNCFAWGKDAHSAATNGSIGGYAGFGGTSAAAAIIAGAALSIQSLVEKSTGDRLSGMEMRALLGDPAKGTAAVDDPPGEPARIGVMPNLRSIIEAGGFGSGPDVFLRDHLTDIGDVHDGPTSMSPDIIVLPSVGIAQDPPVADGQSAYGAGSGQEDNDALSAIVTGGRDHFIYVRVTNRGAVDAQNVTATVYWAPPATLVTPDMWSEIGTTAAMTVPAGGGLTVSAPLRWVQAKLPAAGHYCFVALVGADGDPKPDPAQIPAWLSDWEVFLQLIRNSNNITWRNFNVY